MKASRIVDATVWICCCCSSVTDKRLKENFPVGATLYPVHEKSGSMALTVYATLNVSGGERIVHCFIVTSAGSSSTPKPTLVQNTVNGY